MFKIFNQHIFVLFRFFKVHYVFYLKSAYLSVGITETNISIVDETEQSKNIASTYCENCVLKLAPLVSVSSTICTFASEKPTNLKNIPYIRIEIPAESFVAKLCLEKTLHPDEYYFYILHNLSHSKS